MLPLALGLMIFVVLMVIAFLSGIGITTIGPGGIFVTIALYLFTPLSSAEVAGTAHVTFVATGLVGTAAYVRSGEMRASETHVVALTLSIASIAGALGGAYLNAYVPRPTFGLLLGATTVAVGVLIVYRERNGTAPMYTVDVTTRTGHVVLGISGLVLGGCSGLLGIGGPVLAVPALILIGVPMLSAVAAAQVQSIFIATFAAAGYLYQGNVSLLVAAIVGLPLLGGVVVGWKVAHVVDPARLKLALGVVLAAVGFVLVL